MLIRQMHQKNVILGITSTFSTKDLSLNHVCNGCHDLIQ